MDDLDKDVKDEKVTFAEFRAGMKSQWHLFRPKIHNVSKEWGIPLYADDRLHIIVSFYLFYKDIHPSSQQCACKRAIVLCYSVMFSLHQVAFTFKWNEGYFYLRAKEGSS